MEAAGLRHGCWSRRSGSGSPRVAVANMVDCFLLLTLARTGDQLQGIKKGVPRAGRT